MQTLADSDWWTWEVGGDFGTDEPNTPEVVFNFKLFHDVSCSLTCTD